MSLEKIEDRKTDKINTNNRTSTKTNFSEFSAIEGGFTMEWMGSFCLSWYTIQRVIPSIQQ